ncbi:MAG: hypothetical protein ACFHX7_24530 [Pseudomonadota bacterium]
MKVVLIGGTSHVGKSTFAKALAARLGWQSLSTDSLARHPGRPWRAEGELPGLVRDYFAGPYSSRLLDEVTAHYQQIVWPIVEALVRSRIANAYDGPLVVEGSAILPGRVAQAALPGDQAIALWLTAPHALLTSRMRENSRYTEQSRQDQALVDTFLARTLAFDHYVRESAAALELAVADLGSPAAWEERLALTVANVKG